MRELEEAGPSLGSGLLCILGGPGQAQMGACFSWVVAGSLAVLGDA